MPDDGLSAAMAIAHRGEGKRVHVGPINSVVAGRTDHLPMHVPSGAYVLPADIVSAMGEGNTAAGFRIATMLFGDPVQERKAGGRTRDMFSDPFRGSGTPYGSASKGMPYGVNTPHKKAGGATSAVPIVAAGGEFVISPESVLRHGRGSLEDGHKILDEFVKRYRARTIKTLQKLPGPAKN